MARELGLAPRPIRRLLVANRGEIARRVFATARSMGIGTVAVYADPDAGGRFVREADVAVALGGVTAADSYLHVDKLIEAARRANADAVHPGYGFLAENAAFARAVEAAGLCFVGPSPETIEIMGDKLAALERVGAASVPVLPRVRLPGGALPDARDVAATVGYPLLVKASAGGGGKGMRIVTAPDQLADAVAGARREAGRSFGDDTVFLERLVDPARHIEVQILADHERVVHVFERECSVQRRHQKVIEESPSPFCDAALRDALTGAAIAVARSVDYRGAGTVEFVVGADAGFYFLEMNTRLQVEHPVTEAVTGIDLVRQQLLVAQGLRLELGELSLSGAAIEARVYAENPAAGFLPSSGRLALFVAPGDVRVEVDVETGDEVGVSFDPMLAKVVAHAPTRAEAAAVLARALASLRACGPATNRELLVRVLRDADFRAGDTTTDFIERHLDALVAGPDALAVANAAVVAALTARAARLASQTGRLPITPGWRNSRAAGESVGFRHGETDLRVSFAERRDGRVLGEIDGEPFSARVLDVEAHFVDVELDGLRRQMTAVTDGSRWWIQDASGTEVVLEELPRFPPPPVVAPPAGSLTAPMNGTVVHVAVQAGAAVSAGQQLLSIEAMKMDHPLLAPVDGVVTRLLVAPGASVAEGQVLVILEDPDGVDTTDDGAVATRPTD